ncbi:hypothetical protein EXN66_Car016586 [Channa argus]|uniref:Uncharacterized protein n=1 Tax=Channa argus TaxID=215402 RepID=A0A6G1QF87_CHAAH|nr:hypothetical protein EXN66_Car016586 [Channa argus]
MGKARCSRGRKNISCTGNRYRQDVYLRNKSVQSSSKYQFRCGNAVHKRHKGTTSAEIRSRRPSVIMGEVGTVRADRCRRWRRSAGHFLTEDVAAAVGEDS